MTHNLFRSRIELIISEGKPDKDLALAGVLETLSRGYGHITGRRRRQYASGKKMSGKLSCPVISVGNIVAGGTGKTPFVIFLAERCLSGGLKPMILSRGYRGGFEHTGGIVSDGESVLATPFQAGDEPYMMATSLGVPVVCGKNRFEMGQKAIKQFAPDVVILDDGFQHMQVHRDINILLMDAKHPFGNGHLIPRGPLREPETAISDADAVVFTRGTPRTGALDMLKSLDPALNWFSSDHIGRVTKGLSSLSELRGKRVVGFSGIAAPDRFRQSLEEYGAHVSSFFSFSDHHRYDRTDFNRIKKACINTTPDFLVTTAKDAVKIPDMNDIWHSNAVLDVSIDMGHTAARFDTWLHKQIRELLG